MISKKRYSVLFFFFLFLTGTFCLIIWGSFTPATPDREQGEGGSAASGDEEVNWRFVPSQHEEEETMEPPCSLRSKVRNDPLLSSTFRFSVPVLQWAGSFSAAWWKQLKDQAPPYGWKDLPRHVVGSALRRLNTSRLFDRYSSDTCIRCAVVGSGGILRGSQQGENIDRHDLVFRMNGAVIQGFEKDVGTKTSFYGFTTNTMKNALRWYHIDGFNQTPQSPEVKYIFIPSDLRDYVMVSAAVEGRSVLSGEDRGDRPSKYFGHKAPESFKVLHPNFISYVTRSFLESYLMYNVHTRHLYMPSTGALMLLTAVHTCDQVSAYGFITRNYASFSSHYYDSWWTPLKFYANHDLQMESRLWEALHQRGVITLYQRDDNG